jgi:adenosylcobinamide-GDP ribazoletransferase
MGPRLTGLRVAASFLTRLPVGTARWGPAEIARSVVWFPVIGAGVGLGVAGVFAAALEVLPPLPAAALAVSFGIVATGAFHEDGLADTVDALGGASRDDALRIMKDPSHGTYGGLALVASVLFRTGALAALDAWEAVAALTAAHALSRAAAVGLIGALPAAADEGLGVSYARAVGSRQVFGAVAVALVIGTVGLRLWVLAAIACAALAAFAVGRLAVAKVGGITGDVLGATQQVTEITILLLAAGVAT